MFVSPSALFFILSASPFLCLFIISSMQRTWQPEDLYPISYHLSSIQPMSLHLLPSTVYLFLSISATIPIPPPKPATKTTSTKKKIIYQPKGKQLNPFHPLAQTQPSPPHTPNNIKRTIKSTKLQTNQPQSIDICT